MPAPSPGTERPADPALDRGPSAKAGFVCGIAGLVIPVVSFVAIALAVVALRKSSPADRSSRRAASVALVLGAIGVVTSGAIIAAILIYSAYRGLGAQQAACAARMQKIGQALMMYAHDDRRLSLPPDLATLVRARNLSPELFVDPADDARTPAPPGPAGAGQIANGSPHCSYIYPWRPGWNATLAPSIVILYEPMNVHDNAGANFMFGDTRVRWFDAATAHGMIKQIEAGTNPPNP